MTPGFPPAPHHPHTLAGAGGPSAPARRRWLQLALGCGALQASAAQALEAPRGPVVLTLTGRVRRLNASDRADFDMPMLEALQQHTIHTRTPWYANARRFTGPLLRDVLAAAGAQGSLLRLIALNDYRVDMPYDDPQRHDVLLARLLDDRPMAVRDKGPLFAIYPFDAHPALRTAVYYSRSAWQLRTIDVR